MPSLTAARRAGYQVLAADKDPQAAGFSRADQGFVCDLIDREGIWRLAEKNSVSAIVPLNDFGVSTAAWVAEKMGLPGISTSSAELATKKGAMRRRWLEKGVPCPAFAIAETDFEIRQAVESIGLPCILKPASGLGGGSRGVVAVLAKKELEKAISFSRSFYPSSATLVESFVEAKTEHSVEVVICEGQVHIIAVSDKIKTPLPYRVDKNVLYPSRQSGDALQDLKRQVKDAVQALDLDCGAAHVELAGTADGFVLFELGARCGGGGTPAPIIPFATGVDEFAEVVRILAGDKPANLKPLWSRGCDYHFLLPPPGRIRGVSGLEQVLRLEGVLDADVFPGPGDTISPVTAGQQRSGFIITGAETRDEAYQLGLYAESLIKFDYY